MATHADQITVPHARRSVGGLRMPSLAVIITTLLALVLQWVVARIYVDLVVDLFGGARNANAASGAAVAVSYFFTAIASTVCALYCQRRTGPSRMIVVVHLIAVIIPLQALIAAQFELAHAEFADVVTLAYIGVLAFGALMPEINIPRAGTGVRVAVILLACLVTAYVYGALIAFGGLARVNFDLTVIYEVRDEFLEHLAPFMGYLVPWQGSVINPAIMLLGFKRRSLPVALLGLALQLFLFSMTGFKSFLLMPVLLIGLLMIARARYLTAVSLAGVLSLVAVALLLYAWLDLPVIPALLVDRVIVIPAEIHYWYYDFFGIRGQAPLQLSQSVLAAVTSAHYSTPIAEVIGWKYMGSQASANVGLFGDAFANFGFAGCFIFALLFALLLKAVDAAARSTDPRIAVALVGMASFQLVNSGLLTTLLTHGLALAIVALWLFGANLPEARTAARGSS